MPEFNDLEQEREHLKLHLAAAIRVFGELGFDEGVAGHLTVRDPMKKDCFWVNPFGHHFSMTSVSDLILVDHSGDVVFGNRPVNRAAFAIHSTIHAQRPDVNAACHSHSLYGKAFSSLGKLMDPITQDSCAFFEDHGIFDDYSGVVLDLDEAKRIGIALGEKKAVILKNHGLLTVGSTIDEAAWWFIAMDRSCGAQLLAEAAGVPHLIDRETALLTRSQVGSAPGGWFSFQPMFNWILHKYPDVAE
ncbi:MAG: class II aldolase/adducin family protein [Acidimicrobiales bacterium]|nr:class II aldolase/adducin family protein [Acidimicrobiales bacterium]